MSQITINFKQNLWNIQHVDLKFYKAFVLWMSCFSSTALYVSSAVCFSMFRFPVLVYIGSHKQFNLYINDFGFDLLVLKVPLHSFNIRDYGYNEHITNGKKEPNRIKLIWLHGWMLSYAAKQTREYLSLFASCSNTQLSAWIKQKESFVKHPTNLR